MLFFSRISAELAVLQPFKPVTRSPDKKKSILYIHTVKHVPVTSEEFFVDGFISYLGRVAGSKNKDRCEDNFRKRYRLHLAVGTLNLEKEDTIPIAMGDNKMVKRLEAIGILLGKS
jgi:hypothetical protein